MRELLDAVVDIFRGKEAERAADFDALVRSFDDPTNPPTPATVAEELESLNKSPDDLQKAVAYRRQRLALGGEMNLHLVHQNR